MPSNSKNSGWTRLNIRLHWFIVALIVAQWVEGGDMTVLWDGTLVGKPVSATNGILGYTHIVCGSFILACALVRLLDRWTNGRPAYPAANPNWATWLAKATHLLLYAIIIAVPILGLSAWSTGLDWVAGYHTLLWNPLLAIASLHIFGALAEHFYFKSPALARMVPALNATQGPDG